MAITKQKIKGIFRLEVLNLNSGWLFAKEIGRRDLIKLSFSEQPEDISQFKEELKISFKQKELSEWMGIFDKLEACVEPVLTFAETCEHPESIARGMVVDVPDGQGGVQKQIGCPIKTTVFKPKYSSIGPKPGTHSNEIIGNRVLEKIRLLCLVFFLIEQVERWKTLYKE